MAKSLDVKRSSAGADDPFYPREGKTLTWSNIDMTLAGNKKTEPRALLSNVWGEVPNKEITAILGPSGAGKTSLLNILSGRARTGGKITIEVDVRLNNFSVDPTDIGVRKQIAFVAQDDSLLSTATPREAIRFSAKLRLPRSTTDAELDKLTDTMLASLGLMHCADTLVGGPLLKGISGGERKRTSIGVELVTKPSLVFLDEPTSGLDSYSAEQVVELLHKVANAGSSVLFTIHQPASEIFNNFDQVILMNHGRVMYQGSVKAVPTYFETCGHAIPPNYNPADWIMSVAQRFPEEGLEAAGFFKPDNRGLGSASDSKEGTDALGNSIHDLNLDVDTRAVSVGTQISLLFKREFTDLKRDIPSLAMRFGITIFLNLLFGVIFSGVGKLSNEENRNTQSHFGALIMVQLSSMFGTAQPALFAIPEQRPIFLREYSTDHYSVFAYFLSRLSMEAFITFLQILVQNIIVYFMIGFQANFFLFNAIIYSLAMASTAVAVLLGCSVSDAKMAQELLPMLFVPQMLFAGFFVSITLLPNWLRWVQYICSLTYGVRLGLIAEFDECANGTEGSVAQDNCNSRLEDVNADMDDVWWYWVVLISLFIVLRVSALGVLKAKASSFY